jgi:hypothetical protein
VGRAASSTSPARPTRSPKLMGKGEAQARRELMELHGDAVGKSI